MVSKRIQFNHISEEHEDSRFKSDTRLFQMQILRTDVFRYLKLRVRHDPAIVTFFGVIG